MKRKKQEYVSVFSWPGSSEMFYWIYLFFYLLIQIK